MPPPTADAGNLPPGSPRATLLADMLGPLRTLISVTFLVLLLWAAFSVKLGRLTFADHVDRIGQTPEARELIDGARSRVRPTLDEVKQRLLGEYVEAPTHLAGSIEPLRPAQPARSMRPPVTRLPATPDLPRDATPGGLATSGASTADAAKLPGRRKP